MATKRVKNIKYELRCPRCRGRMLFEKFYAQNTFFFGWHCLVCGDILDPVIFLHRVTKNADVSIPESEEEFLALFRKYAPKLLTKAAKKGD